MINPATVSFVYHCVAIVDEDFQVSTCAFQSDSVMYVNSSEFPVNALRTITYNKGKCHNAKNC